MAASLKAPQKMKLDYNVDRDTYNDFMRKCTEKGFAPNIVVERLMKRFNENGQM